jgi:hypothetical protein
MIIKRIFLLALSIGALAGNLKAGVVEYQGMFISSEDASKLGLVATSVSTRTDHYDVAGPADLTEMRSLASQWSTLTGQLKEANHEEQVSIALKCRPIVERMMTISTRTGQLTEECNAATVVLKALYAALGLKY